MLAAAGFIPALFALCVLAVALWKLDAERRQQFMESQKKEVEARLMDLASQISMQVDGDIKLSRGLEVALGLHPDMDQAAFSALAGGLFKGDNSLRNVAGAPDLVVGMVYPEAENSRALGLDYRNNPEQKAAAFEAMQTREIVVTGPVHLVQGGMGLIIRYPVFRHDNGAFWGLLSVVIDADGLFRRVGLETTTDGLVINLAKIEAGQEPAPFFASGVAQLIDPVRVPVDLGYVTWILSAAPTGGWATTSPELTEARLETVGVAAAILLPLVWAGVLLRQHQRKTEALQARDAEMAHLSQRLEMALSASAIGVWEYDTANGGLEWDARMRELYGASEGRSRFAFADWRDALHPDDLVATEKALRRTVELGEKFFVDFRIVRPDGAVRYIRGIGNPFKTGEGVRVLGVNWDVTADVLLNQQLLAAKAQADARNAELLLTRERLEFQSMHDVLTGLPNRRYLDAFLAEQDDAAPGSKVSVLHIDLDRFKEINDTLGHAAGDRLLVIVGERLRAVVKPEEFPARVGGDEFVVVVRGEQSAQRAKTLATEIVRSMATPFDLNGAPCRIGCSVGLASGTVGDEPIRNILINADIALYEAKKRGKSRVEQFTNHLKLAVVRAREQADEFVQALDRSELVPFYQPQFAAHTLDIIGVEVLARWNHPTRGVLLPNAFLPVAEEINRVGEVDRIMLEKCLADDAQWQAHGLCIPKLSVNLSLARLREESLFRYLATKPVEPSRLSFELLESIDFDRGGAELMGLIARLRQAGVGIEIDDFGTGHASIINLLDLAPDRLKIDQQLVMSVEPSGPRRRLVSSIIEMGRALGIEIVAEGVETLRQVKILSDLGCHVFQGHALAKPMPGSEFLQFATERQRRTAI